MSRSSLTRGVWAGLLLVAWACERPDSLIQTNEVPVAVASAKAEDVVARVDDSLILRDDVVAQMKAGSQDRSEALEALIAERLLLREALRRGLHRRRLVVREQRRALANLWVTRQLVDGFGKADIPQELVAKAYRINKARFVHADLVEVEHIVAMADASHSEEYHRKAKKLVQKAWRIANAGKLSAEEFADITTLLRKEAGDVKVASEPFTAARGHAAHAFVDACEKLRRPGQISPVVKTEFGYHVIYFKSRSPARNTSLSEAEKEIRDRIFDEARTVLLIRRLERLWRDRAVEVDHQALARAFGEKPR